MSDRAPEVIQYIEWFKNNFSRYILHILLLLAFLFGYIYYEKYTILVENSAEEIKILKDRLLNYQGCRTISPYGDRPLQVTFSDKKTAYINTFSTTVPTGKSNYRSKEYLETYFSRTQASLEMLKAVIFSELEVVDIEYARKNREQLGIKIMKKANLKLTQYEIELTQFELLEFCNPQ